MSNHRDTRDGCEMDPKTGEPLYDDNPHYAEARAVWLIGANGQWRVCDSCAKLPTLRRYKVRKRIERKHEWTTFPATGEWLVCRACGIVKNGTSDNRTCRGPVKVGLRGSEDRP